MLRIAALVAAILILAIHNGAEAGTFSKVYQDCINHDDGNAVWAACGKAEIERQDKRLNKAWKAAQVCFPPDSGERKQLLAEQKLWIKWKDASCLYYWSGETIGSSLFGREGEVLYGPGCRANIIAERATFLEELCPKR